MAFFATALSVAGSVLSAIGQIKQGQAAAAAANYNAKVAEVEAASEKDVAAAEGQDFRRRELAARSRAIAERGASGVQLAGAPLLVDENLVREIELGAMRIGQRGNVKATAKLNEATLYRMRGKAALTAGYIGAGSSLLGGLGEAFG